MDIIICLGSWVLILAIGGIAFRRRGYGNDPALAAALHVIPGLGYAYLGAWSRLFFALVPILMGGGFIISLTGLESYANGFSLLVWGGMIVDSFLTAKAKRNKEVHSEPFETSEIDAPRTKGSVE
jgi:hypothetical protein